MTTKTMELPEPSCPGGYTWSDLEALLGPGLPKFNQWMSGQTMMLCDGKRYHYDRAHTSACGHVDGDPFDYKCEYTGTGRYCATSCSDLPEGALIDWDEDLTGHGPVVYASDLERYLAGWPVID